MLLGLIVLVVVTAHKAESMARLVREAMAKAGISLKEAAYLMGEDSAQLSRELAGVGHVSATRLAQLPAKFQQWYAVGLAGEYGLPSELEIARRLGEVTR